MNSSIPCLYTFLLCLVFWFASVPGYWFWLRTRSPYRPTLQPRERPLDKVDIVIAVANEAGMIRAKLEDTRNLDYPPELLRILVVDGCSTDETAAIVADLGTLDDRILLLEHAVANKISQLNAALPLATAPWLLVTDADARMSPETLRALVTHARSDPSLGVIGTPVSRPCAHWLEHCHTSLIDRMRAAEARSGSASIVMGPCYLLRRSVIEKFPADAFCDDVHISFHAAARGYRVGYVEADVRELRSPVSLAALLRHKTRKASAYLHELLRHLPATSKMSQPARSVFIWRASHFLLAPPALFGAAAAAAVATAHLAAGPLLLFMTGLGTLLLVGMSALLLSSKAPPLFRSILLGIFLTATLLVVLAIYPFYRQSSSYKKVAEPSLGTNEQPA